MTMTMTGKNNNNNGTASRRRTATSAAAGRFCLLLIALVLLRSSLVFRTSTPPPPRVVLRRSSPSKEKSTAAAASASTVTNDAQGSTTSVNENDNDSSGGRQAAAAAAPPAVAVAPPTAASQHCLHTKERFVGILRRARFMMVDSFCPLLPTPEEVSKLYGAEPIIHGLDTCERYRRSLLNKGATKQQQQEPMVRVAGMFNSGTNHLVHSLERNPLDGSTNHRRGRMHPAAAARRRYSSINNHHNNKACNPRAGYMDVPWGKHVPAKYKWSNWYPPECRGTNTDKELVLPVVVVRDPYRWIKATCKKPYDIRFNVSNRQYCKLAVSTGEEGGDEDGGSDGSGSRHQQRLVTATATTTNRINVSLAQTQHRFVDYYDSLADMWSEWLDGYVRADYPRLLVRYEDTVFHAEKVHRAIQECVYGGSFDDQQQQRRQQQRQQRQSPYQYVLRDHRSFHWGESPRLPYLATAMAAYGTEKDRYFGFDREDLDHARGALDDNLMRMFGYSHPPDGYVPEIIVPAERGGRRYQDWPEDLANWQKIHVPPPKNTSNELDRSARSSLAVSQK